MNLKEKIAENLTLSILAFAIVAFGAGWGAYDAVIKAGDSKVITANELAKLKDAETQLKKLQEQNVDAQSKQKVRVVFVDAMQRRYYFERDPKEYPEGNADFLIRRIQNSEMSKLVDPIKKLTQRTQQGAILRLSGEEVVQANPDIVVIHRSAFYKEDEPVPVHDDRLVEFLKGIKMKDTVFLVYSRTPETDGKYAYALGNSTGLTDRIFPYQFKLARPFDDRSQVDPFLQTPFDAGSRSDESEGAITVRQLGGGTGEARYHGLGVDLNSIIDFFRGKSDPTNPPPTK